jgi:uncharacterized membrane protein
MKTTKILAVSLFTILAFFCFDHSSLAVGKSYLPNKKVVNDQVSDMISSTSLQSDIENNSSSTPDEIAQASVVKVLAEKEVKQDDGSMIKQQNLELKILTGPLAGQTEQYVGISDINVTSASVYKSGDRLIVSYSPDETGKNVFYITDYVRSGALTWLLLFFIAIVVIVGRWKGWRALLSFFFSFLFIIYIMVPLFLRGWNALLIGIVGSLIILLIIIYLTEGYNRKSHIAVLGILSSLIFTVILSVIFVAASHLTGRASDEVTYLIGAVKNPLDYKNLLLAAMFIGILGMLDDIVMGQVESVMQIKTANPLLPDKKVFNMAMKVGQSHLGAVINTLFLVYISTTLPLILLISLHQAPFVSFSDVINNEQVATEIVRILVGVVGLCSSIPISTWLAAKYLKADSESNKKINSIKISL